MDASTLAPAVPTVRDAIAGGFAVLLAALAPASAEPQMPSEDLQTFG